MQDNTEYIPVEELAVLLGITPRQAARYAEKVRTIKAGKRILYHREDVKELVEERRLEDKARGEARKIEPPKPKAELMPTGEVLSFVREQLDRVDAVQQQLLQAAHRIGALEEENRRLKEALSKTALPWWKRLFAAPAPEPPPQDDTSTSDQT